MYVWCDIKKKKKKTKPKLYGVYRGQDHKIYFFLKVSFMSFNSEIHLGCQRITPVGVVSYILSR